MVAPAIIAALIGAAGSLGAAGMNKLGKSNNGYDYEIPEFQNGNFTLNGFNRASINKSGNNITSNINETPEEQEQRRWRQNTVYGTEKTVGAPSSELLSRWEDIAGSRKNRALEAYDEDVFNPALKAFKEKAYSQWGGANNSQSVIGFDKLLTDRDKQRANLATTYDENLFDFGNQEDSRLMTLANFLQTNQSTQDSLLQSYLNNAVQASTLGNNQALSAAGIQNGLAGIQQQQEQASQAGQLQALLSALGIAGMFMPSSSGKVTGAASSIPASSLGWGNSSVNSLPRWTGATY